MLSHPRKRREARFSLTTFSMSFLVLLLMLLTACGSSGGTTTGGGSGSTSNALPCNTVSATPNATALSNGATPSLNKPKDLITAGTLTVGSDTTYPPQEFIDTTTGKATGFDVDLITAMAQKLGLKAKIVTANFNTIIDDLAAKRYDVVISALSINPDRQKKADF